jgi:hypothetical protein
MKGVLPRDAKSVSGCSVAHEAEGVLPRDAKSVSVLIAHEVEGVPIREARSVSAARDSECTSVAHDVEGVLRRDAKSVSEGVLLRDARSASVACDAESASDSHEVEGTLRRDVERLPAAREVPKRSASRRTEMGRMTSASRPPEMCFACEAEGVLRCDAKSVSVARVAKSASVASAMDFVTRDAESASVAHEVEGAAALKVVPPIEGVLPRRDAKSVSVAHEVEARAKSVSVAHEVEGVLRRDAKSVSFAHDAKSVSEGVLPRDAKNVSGARDAVSASAAHEAKGELRHDAKSASVPLDAESAPVAHEVEGVLRYDSKNVPAAYPAAHEIEGVLRRDAKSVSEGVLPRDAKSVSVARDAESVPARESSIVEAGSNTSEALEADTCMLRGLVGVVRESSVFCDEAFAPAWHGCRCEPCVQRRAMARELGTLLEMKCLEGCGGLVCSEMSVELSARLRLRTEHLPIVAEVLSMTMPDLMVAMRTRSEESVGLWAGYVNTLAQGLLPLTQG